MLESAKSMISDIKRSSLSKIIEFTTQNRGIYGLSVDQFYKVQYNRKQVFWTYIQVIRAHKYKVDFSSNLE
jgi:hypothetical protein